MEFTKSVSDQVSKASMPSKVRYDGVKTNALQRDGGGAGKLPDQVQLPKSQESVKPLSCDSKKPPEPAELQNSDQPTNVKQPYLTSKQIRDKFTEIQAEELKKIGIEKMPFIDRDYSKLPLKQQKPFLITRGWIVEKAREEDALPNIMDKLNLSICSPRQHRDLLTTSPEVEVVRPDTRSLCKELLEEKGCNFNKGSSEYYMLLGTPELVERVSHFSKDCIIKSIAIREQSVELSHHSYVNYEITLDIDDDKGSRATPDR